MDTGIAGTLDHINSRKVGHTNINNGKIRLMFDNGIQGVMAVRGQGSDANPQTFPVNSSLYAFQDRQLVIG